MEEHRPEEEEEECQLGLGWLGDWMLGFRGQGMVGICLGLARYNDQIHTLCVVQSSMPGGLSRNSTLLLGQALRHLGGRVGGWKWLLRSHAVKLTGSWDI